MNIPADFYTRVEDPRFLHYVLYGDTDSLFLHVPFVHYETTKEAIEKAQKIAKQINDRIQAYLNVEMLPKMGVDPKYNFTDFKTELVIKSLMLLEVKKNYALKIIAEKDEVFSSPKIKYTGLPIVKADVAALAKQFLKELVDNIVLNEEIPLEQKLDHCERIREVYKKRTKEACDNFQIHLIGKPAKMSNTESNAHHIQAMKRWNTWWSNDFKLGTSGYLVYTDRGELAVPFWYDEHMVKRAFEKMQLKLDINAIWNKFIYITITQRIIKLCAKYCQDPLKRVNYDVQ